jgi:hypothetical protein
MIQNCLAKTTFEDGYVLQLGNEQGWQLVPTEGVRLEVEELARIMRLKSRQKIWGKFLLVLVGNLTIWWSLEFGLTIICQTLSARSEMIWEILS